MRKLDEHFIKTIAKTTDVKLICTVSTGFDNIDTDAARKNRIRAINVFGGNSDCTAEHTFTMLLAFVKKIPQKSTEMKKGLFKSNYNNSEIFGKTIGIVGVGRIGSRVAKIARAFGMNVLGNDIKPSLQKKYPWVKFVSLNKLLAASDFVTVHTPLDKTTYHLLSSKNLKLLKPETILINCARGGIVDESALIDILKKKKIMGACLDVFENEPDFNKKISMLDNVLLTPHLAGKTAESKKRMALFTASNIIRICS